MGDTLAVGRSTPESPGGMAIRSKSRIRISIHRRPIASVAISRCSVRCAARQSRAGAGVPLAAVASVVLEEGGAGIALMEGGRCVEPAVEGKSY